MKNSSFRFTSFPLVRAAVLMLASLFALGTSSSAMNEPALRVLLIPLDDRPPCLQWPILMGEIAGAEVVAPPRSLLGRFTEPGQPDAIAEWMRELDLDTFDAAIVSLDMLAFGGLVASRIPATAEAEALARLEVLRQISEKNPTLTIYGSSVIMRLAPTADGQNEGYRSALARWAEYAPYPERAEAVARLVQSIPPAALAGYQEARTRNLALNRAALGLVQEGVLDFLLLSQDDAKTRGVHVAEREALLEKIRRAGLSERVTLQPGTDEVSMLLLSRFVTERFEQRPAVAAIFSSDAAREIVAPFEDAKLHETVSLQIAAAGARETPVEEADLLFFVYASRLEQPDQAVAFADQIAEAVASGKHVIVADIDTFGRTQGAHLPFATALRERRLLSRLYGYASWNTAGNTIGTALPQGILRVAAEQKAGTAPLFPAAIERAHTDYLLRQIINDYLYHGLTRPDINRLPVTEREERLREVLPPLARDLAAEFLPEHEPDSLLRDFDVHLPWGRSFEAEIDFRRPK